MFNSILNSVYFLFILFVPCLFHFFLFPCSRLQYSDNPAISVCWTTDGIDSARTWPPSQSPAVDLNKKHWKLIGTLPPKKKDNLYNIDYPYRLHIDIHTDYVFVPGVTNLGAGTLLPGHAVNAASIMAEEPEPFTVPRWRWWWPPVISWFISPLTIDISPIFTYKP